MEGKDIIAILMGILFASSAMFMSISQNRQNSASDRLIFSIISLENSDYIRGLQTDVDFSQTNLLIINNRMAINTNYACLALILAKDMHPFNQTIYEELKKSCLEPKYEEIKIGELRNYSDPFLELNESFTFVKDYRAKSDFWQNLSIWSFILGILTVVWLIEWEVINRHFRKQKL